MRRVLLLAGATIALAGCGGGGGTGTNQGAPTPNQVGETPVDMQAFNESGQTGQVSLSPSDDGGTNVVAEVSGAQGVAAQPFGIHRGTCEAPETPPAYELPPLDEGFFAGTIETPYEEITTGEFVIVVMESPEAPDVVVSCGTIGSEG